MNIQQLRAQITALQDATMDENRNFRSGYDEGKFDALSAVDALLDSLQEEPVSKTPADVESAMQEVEEKSKAFTKAHKGENADDILAQMRGEEPVSKQKLSNSFNIGKDYKEEPVSKELEEAAHQYYEPNDKFMEGFKKGVKWQKEKEYTCYEEAFEDGAKWKVENLWKPADGDDLPEIDREVIAILDNGKVVFAHRPPEFWDGKNVVTGKVTRNYPKTYDKGGWNIPNVKWWLDCSLPNMEED